MDRRVLEANFFIFYYYNSGEKTPYLLFPFRQFYNKDEEKRRPKIEGDDVKEVVEAAFPVGKPPLVGEDLIRLIRRVDIYVSFLTFFNLYFLELQLIYSKILFLKRIFSDLSWRFKMVLGKITWWYNWVEILQKIQGGGS